ncbi:MAG: hypothetical protein WC241_04150 [Candidatus Paceibacterota bacterium]|jgi:hypothetical protein
MMKREVRGQRSEVRFIAALVILVALSACSTVRAVKPEAAPAITHTPKIEQAVSLVKAETGPPLYFVEVRDVALPESTPNDRIVGFFILDQNKNVLLQLLKPGYSFQKQ